MDNCESKLIFVIIGIFVLYFWLDPKVPKDQDKKILPPTNLPRTPVFCRAGALWVFKI